MTTRLFALAALVLGLVPLSAEAQFRAQPDIVPAEDFHVELGLLFWSPTPDIALTTGDALVGTVDFVQEFGIDNERFREFRAVIKAARKHKIRFSYVPLHYDQDAVLERTITFQNVTFPVSANANADINWDLFRFGYEWDFISRSRGFVGLVTELKYNHVDADITASSQFFGQTVSLIAGIDQPAPVPTIGAIGRGYLGQYVSITSEFTFFRIERDQWRGKFYDFEITGAAHLGRNLGAQVGWRTITVDFLIDEDAGDRKMKGPYFGGFVRF